MKPSVRFQLLRACLVALGAVACFIGFSGFVFGTKAIAATEWLYEQFSATTYPRTIPGSATLDSEFRFYEAFWFSYGIALNLVAFRLEHRLRYVVPLTLVFFVGGVGRLISILVVGFPHPVFVLLAIPEIVLAVIMIALWYGLRNQIACEQ